MEQCVNTIMTDRYLDKMDTQEKLYSQLLQEIEGELKELEEIVDRLKRASSDYYGYDFSEDIGYEIKDRL